MSVLQLVQATEWPLYRRTMAALGAVVARGPAFFGADTLSLLAITLLASLFSVMRARLGKEGR